MSDNREDIEAIDRFMKSLWSQTATQPKRLTQVLASWDTWYATVNKDWWISDEQLAEAKLRRNEARSVMGASIPLEQLPKTYDPDSDVIVVNGQTIKPMVVEPPATLKDTLTKIGWGVALVGGVLIVLNIGKNAVRKMIPIP